MCIVLSRWTATERLLATKRWALLPSSAVVVCTALINIAPTVLSVTAADR